MFISCSGVANITLRSIVCGKRSAIKQNDNFQYSRQRNMGSKMNPCIPLFYPALNSITKLVYLEKGSVLKFTHIEKIL